MAFQPELNCWLESVSYLDQSSLSYRYPILKKEDRDLGPEEFKEAFRIAAGMYHDMVARLPQEVIWQEGVAF